jgi:hypothetical protein
MRPDLGDADQPEQASAWEHLDQCADCQAFLEARRSFEIDATDRELGRAMRGVTVPVDLKARLLAQFAAAAQPTPASSPASDTAVTPVAPASTSVAVPVPVEGDRAEQTRSVQPRQPSRRWVLAAISAALVFLTVGTSWWLFQFTQKSKLTVDELVKLAHEPLPIAVPVFQQSFEVELPVHEIRIPAKPEKMLSLRYKGREIGAMIPFRPFRSSLEAVLVVVDLKRVLVPDQNTVGENFDAARNDYPNDVTTRTWHVGDQLYICYVKSKDREILKRLKSQSTTA